MPLKHKIIPKLCEVCKETQEDKFTPCSYTICKECKKKKNKKSYLCKFCGETEESMFYEGRYSNCKKCFNTKRVNNPEIIKYIDSSDKKVEKDEIVNFDIRKNLRKLIQCDTNIMDGSTIKQAIEENKTEILKNASEIEFLKKENIFLKEQICQNLAAIDEFHNYVKRIVDNYEKLLEDKN
jgi:hypothetical protein